MRLLVLLLLIAGCYSAPAPSGPPPSEPDRTERPSTAPTDGAPDLGALPDLVHRAANDARRAEGVAALAWRADLAAVAAAHSRDMAARDYFAHNAPDGTSPQDRARAAGVDCRTALGGGSFRVGVSENLYQTSAYRQIRTTTIAGRTTRTVDWFAPREIAQATIDGWLDSPGHRRNLLDDVSTAHGIGVARDGEDRVFITQVLC